MNTYADNNSKLYLPEDPFEGTLKDLLAILTEHPAYVEPIKATFSRLVHREGVVPVRSAEIQRIYGVESLVAYKAFDDFYGVEPYVHGIMNDYFGAALAGHEADKQALVLIGPPGAGKSDIVAKMKKIFRKAEPMPYLDGCPKWDNPLNILFMVPVVALKRTKGKVGLARKEAVKIIEKLNITGKLDWNAPKVIALADKYDLPKEARKLLSEKEGKDEGALKAAVDELNAALGVVALADVGDFVSVIVFGLGLPQSTRNSIGMPCPFCQDRVLGEFADKERKDEMYGKYDPSKSIEIADFPLDAMHLSMGQGIVDVPEVQPLNFDLSTWIGKPHIANVAKYDSRDPRVAMLNGYFNRGKVVIITEGLKNPVEARRVELEALQGRRVALPQPLASFHTDGMHWEGLIIIHSNEGEYNKFRADIVNEPYWDRYLRILFKYPLEASEAAKISKKLWNLSDFAKPLAKGGVHKEPILDDFEARLRVLSYLELDSRTNISPMTILNAYDGKQVREKGMGTVVDTRALREKATWREGMEGFSPRETAKVVGARAAQSLQLKGASKVKCSCVTTRDFRDAFIETMKVNIADQKKRDKIMGFLSNELEEWRRQQLSRIVRAAFVEEFQTECQNLFDRYVQWSNASVLGTTPRGVSSWTRVSQNEMESFLREIESDPDWGIVPAQAPKFRQEVQAAVSEYIREHGNTKVPYTVHEGIKNCIERRVLSQVKDVARIFSTSSSQSDEDRRKIEGAKNRLITQHGFCEHCAEQLLIEVQTTRGFLKE